VKANENELSLREGQHIPNFGSRRHIHKQRITEESYTPLSIQVGWYIHSRLLDSKQ
jgi:hypothetical protein